MPSTYAAVARTSALGEDRLCRGGEGGQARVACFRCQANVESRGVKHVWAGRHLAAPAAWLMHVLADLSQAPELRPRSPQPLV